MTISYPIQCPTHLAPSSVRWTIATACTISQSPSTFKTIKYEYDAEAWMIDVSYPPLKREEAAPFIAFLASLRGQSETFLFGDTLASSPLGTGGGTPRVNGAGQERQKFLVTNQWTPSTLVLKAGDFFQVGNRLYMNLTDVTSDASGNATLNVFPRVRFHETGASLVLNMPKGIFRLNSDQIIVSDAGVNQMYSVSFSAMEAV